MDPDTDKYRSTFAASVTSEDSALDSGSGRGSSSSSGSSSSTKFFRVRQLDSSTGGKDGGQMLDCRLGTDHQTGQQQVEMIFSLDPLASSGSGNLLGNGVMNFAHANIKPPEPILFKAGDSNVSGLSFTQHSDVISDESPVFIGEQSLLSRATNASWMCQQQVNSAHPLQANISPSETFSISRLDDVGAMKERLQRVKHLLIGVTEFFKLDQDNRSYYFIYLCLLAAFVLHYSLSRIADCSTVTSISLFVLCIMMFEFYSELIFNRLDQINIRQKQDKWTSKDDERFDAICRNLGHVENRLKFALRDLNSMRHSKSKMAYVNGALVLLFIAWLGSVLDGILIVYLICTATVGVIQFDLGQKIHQS